MKCSVKNKEVLNAIAELGKLREHVEKARLQENFCKQGFHLDARAKSDLIKIFLKILSEIYSRRRFPLVGKQKPG